MYYVTGIAFLSRNPRRVKERSAEGRVKKDRYESKLVELCL